MYKKNLARHRQGFTHIFLRYAIIPVWNSSEQSSCLGPLIFFNGNKDFCLYLDHRGSSLRYKQGVVPEEGTFLINSSEGLFIEIEEGGKITPVDTISWCVKNSSKRNWWNIDLRFKPPWSVKVNMSNLDISESDQRKSGIDIVGNGCCNIDLLLTRRKKLFYSRERKTPPWWISDENEFITTNVHWYGVGIFFKDSDE